MIRPNIDFYIRTPWQSWTKMALSTLPTMASSCKSLRAGSQAWLIHGVQPCHIANWCKSLARWHTQDGTLEYFAQLCHFSLFPNLPLSHSLVNQRSHSRNVDNLPILQHSQRYDVSHCCVKLKPLHC